MWVDIPYMDPLGLFCFFFASACWHKRFYFSFLTLIPFCLLFRIFWLQDIFVHIFSEFGIPTKIPAKHNWVFGRFWGHWGFYICKSTVCRATSPKNSVHLALWRSFIWTITNLKADLRMVQGETPRQGETSRIIWEMVGYPLKNTRKTYGFCDFESRFFPYKTTRPPVEEISSGTSEKNPWGSFGQGPKNLPLQRNRVWFPLKVYNPLALGFKYFFFHPIWGRFPFWLIFFRFETTNYSLIL